MIVVVIVAVVVIAGVAWVQWRITQVRMHKIAAVAAANGWTFNAADIFGCGDKPFHLFARGHARQSTNVCSLHASNGTTLHLFDYRFTEGYGKSADTYKHTCVLLEGRDRFPLLTIEHESLGSGVLSAIGVDDLQFESEEFNRTFRITSDDARFACAVIDARMMQYLLDHDTSAVHISLTDRYLLMWGSRIQPEQLPVLERLASGFWSLIPPVVRELYPGY